MQHDDEIEGNKNPVPDEDLKYLEGLLNQLKQHLWSYYEPVTDPQDAEFHFSTEEVWQQLLQIFPNEFLFTKEHVAAWLHQGGFRFHDYGNMRLEWMMKKV